MKKLFFALVAIALPIFASVELEKRPQNVTVIPQPAQETKDEAVQNNQTNQTALCPCHK